MHPPAKPPFRLVVVGAGQVSPAALRRTLDRLTARVRAEYRLVVVTRGGEGVGDWCRGHEAAGVACELDAVARDLYGRFAEPRWAMKAISLAGGVVIFGDEGPWWRLVRYARDAGVPVRRVAVPAAGEQKTPPG